jgi:hypothetical protein
MPARTQGYGYSADELWSWNGNSVDEGQRSDARKTFSETACEEVTTESLVHSTRSAGSLREEEVGHTQRYDGQALR